MPAAIPPKVGTTTPCRRMRGASRRPRRPAPPLVESHIATSARDSPLPEELACACISTKDTGFASPRLRGAGFGFAETRAARRSGGEGRCRKRRLPAPQRPFDAAPHPRLLRRLAAFGSPLPASGERREALLFERLERSVKPLARRRGEGASKHFEELRNRGKACAVVLPTTAWRSLCFVVVCFG